MRHPRPFIGLTLLTCAAAVLLAACAAPASTESTEVAMRPQSAGLNPPIALAASWTSDHRASITFESEYTTSAVVFDVLRGGKPAAQIPGGSGTPGRSGPMAYAWTDTEPGPCSGASFDISVIASAPATGATSPIAGPVSLADVCGTPTDTPIPAAGGNAVDLRLFVRAAEPSVVAGGELRYFVTAENVSDSGDASQVTITFALPSSLTWLSFTQTDDCAVSLTSRECFALNPPPPSPACSGTSAVVCQLGSLSHNHGRQYALTVGTTSTGDVTASASVSADQSDSRPSDNTASWTTHVDAGPTPTPVAADLSITLTDDHDPAKSGEIVSYWAEVQNNTDPSATGAVGVTGLKVTVPLPAGVTSSRELAPFCDLSGNVLTCEGGIAVPFAVLVNTDTTYSLTAQVTADQFDPNTANNTASQTTTVSGSAQVDLSVSVMDLDDPALVGQDVRYSVRFFNESNYANASNVALTLNLPTTATLVSIARVANCTLRSGARECESFSPIPVSICTGDYTQTCDLGSLRHNSGADYRITVRPLYAVPLAFSASISGEPSDDRPSNNSESVGTTVNLSATATSGPQQQITATPSRTPTRTITPTPTRTATPSRTPTKTATATPTPIPLSSLSFLQTSVKGGSAAMLTIQLATAAPAGGTTVRLTSSNTKVVVSVTVTVPAGQTSASVSLATAPVTSLTTVKITASSGASTLQKSLTVTP